ncbi:MAG: MGMT family protein [Nakamurella sp.]
MVALILQGAVTTYGDIARALGVTPRQVGRAMATQPGPSCPPAQCPAR